MKKDWSIRIIIVPVIVIAIALFTFSLPTKADPSIGIEMARSFPTNTNQDIWNDLARSKVFTSSLLQSQAQQFIGSFTAASPISDRSLKALPDDVRELLPERVFQLLDQQEQRAIWDRRRAALPEDVRELLPERVLQLLDRQESKITSEPGRAELPEDVRELLSERVLRLLDTSDSKR